MPPQQEQGPPPDFGNTAEQMANPAQERLEGGPTGEEIRRREFAENAPQ